MFWYTGHVENLRFGQVLAIDIIIQHLTSYTIPYFHDVIYNVLPLLLPCHITKHICVAQSAVQKYNTMVSMQPTTITIVICRNLATNTLTGRHYMSACYSVLYKGK